MAQASTLEQETEIRQRNLAQQVIRERISHWLESAARLDLEEKWKGEAACPHLELTIKIDVFKDGIGPHLYRERHINQDVFREIPE